MYDSRVRVVNGDGPEEITAKTLKTYYLMLREDETDLQAVEWADQPADPSQQRKKSKRQGIRLATMNPETGVIYVILFNQKLLEINPNPSDE